MQRNRHQVLIQRYLLPKDTTMRLNEGLDYHDMKGQIDPKVSVDEYSAKMGEDSEIVTVTFILKSKEAAKDLVSWLEIGYDYILDASVSDGELEPGTWLVFVEMKRRSNVPEKIIQILSDLKTLTDRDVKDYVLTINNEEYDADESVLKQVMILSPNQYKKEKGEEDEDLNEMRNIAGLSTKNSYTVDEEIRKYITNAGL
jgi:hypothetical protein